MEAAVLRGLPDPPAWGPYSWEISSWHASLHFLQCGEKAEEKGRRGGVKGQRGGKEGREEGKQSEGKE